MQNVDMVLKNGRIITMDKELRILRDGALAIHNGKICGVGKTKEIEEKFSTEKIINLRGALLHPGFINAHHHPGVQIIRNWIPDHYGKMDVFRSITNNNSNKQY